MHLLHAFGGSGHYFFSNEICEIGGWHAVHVSFVGNVFIVKFGLSCVDEVVVVITDDLATSSRVEIEHGVAVCVDEVVSFAFLKVDEPVGFLGCGKVSVEGHGGDGSEVSGSGELIDNFDFLGVVRELEPEETRSYRLEV